MKQKIKIIIVGGGAGGLELVTKLGNTLGRKNQAEIILVDHNKSHLWKPLLHEIASGSLDDRTDTLSYLAHAYDHYFHFHLGKLIDIDRKNKTIRLAEIHNKEGKLLVPERQLKFDILVIALGSVSNDFNTQGVKENCVFLDNPKQAYYFHNTISNLFLSYSVNHQLNNKINIAIIGGGATGVELSAELYNTINQLINYGFNGLNKKSLNVILIETGERILPALPIRISIAAHNELAKLGVSILTNTMVTSVDANGINTKSGVKINADLIVWVAGIKAPNFMKQIGGLETNKINQLIVKSTLQTTLDNSIFAIGDCASCSKKDGGFVPPRAQAAHQMAALCYNNIVALIKQQELKPYKYKDHGSLISLSSFNTLGNLMGNLVCGDMMIKGKLARMIYILLYRFHQIALHGYIKTGLMILAGSINRIIKPKIKFY
ncbi:NADH dehydrogenase [Candidatus Arsenophonus lipoptenae]|uniref:NADH dehydrogenase n=1 Tax=Candidatus Arsenophonus lipoptenae TaxID=634113 RepID=A0A0X9VLX6_9GAMM|nr:NAD(P)/FAD-dependent oxidoreductase [Candidatus Arsenophonus lipoptenae]AMA64686.1 NADH dehydrogenase [Candidatus Arsenophonus lipoptenae]